MDSGNRARVSPFVVFAFGVLAPLAVFGATRLLASPKPKAETETSPRVVREFIVIPAAATTEGETRSWAEGTALPVGSVRVAALPQDLAPVVARASTDEPFAFDGAAAAAVASSAPPADLVASSAAPADRAAPSASVAAPSTPPPAPPPPPVPCGITTCAAGDVCCSAACGICAAPGEACTRQDCGLASYPTNAFCGANTCAIGEVCCNPSCGTCAPPGVECSQVACDDGPTYPSSQACGMMSTCNVGSVCCDPSCGLCAPVADCAHLHC
jgi:hypothetical protein